MRALLTAVSGMESPSERCCGRACCLNHGYGSDFRCIFVFRADEYPDARESHEEENDAECCADVAETLAGDVAGCDAPLGGKEPYAISEVPADGDHGDDVD